MYTFILLVDIKFKSKDIYIVKRFLFQMNAVLFNFVFIKQSFIMISINILEIYFNK